MRVSRPPTVNLKGMTVIPQSTCGWSKGKTDTRTLNILLKIVECGDDFGSRLLNKISIRAHVKSQDPHAESLRTAISGLRRSANRAEVRPKASTVSSDGKQEMGARVLDPPNLQNSGNSSFQGI